MSFPGLMMEPATIVKPSTRTSRAGDIISDWDAPIRTQSNCWIWSKSVEENEGLDDEAILNVVLFFPPSANIANEDRIELIGHTFLVSGPPKPKRTVRGLHHYEVDARAEF
jgi:hypothetical protein